MARRYWIAATGSARVINWENLYAHAHNGYVSGKVWTSTPFNLSEFRPLSSLKITRQGQIVETTNTQANGQYQFLTGSGIARLEAKLVGPHVEVIEGAFGKSHASCNRF